MKMPRSLYKAILVISIASLTLLLGCGGYKLRISDSMFQENAIQKIAILSTGRIEWPRRQAPFGGYKEGVLGLTENKQALAILAPKLRDILVNKGYEVVFSEPVGIGYYNPFYKENWVIEKNGEKGERFKKWQVLDNSPAFEYPVVQNNQEFRRAVRNIFEQIELAIYRRELKTFAPSRNDLEIIQQVTRADTICFNRVFGHKYSRARKMVFHNFFGKIYRDIEESSLLFVNASSGEVLWLRRFHSWEDPAAPGEESVSKPLGYFPKINQPMESKCKKKDPVGPIYKCPEQ